MTLIACPSCSNECSPQAPHCPKCGHPFGKNGSKQESRRVIFENAEQNSKKSNAWKILTIVAAVFLFGLLTFVGYRFFSNSSTPSSSTTLANVKQEGSSPTPIPRGKLELEAAIIYSFGGVQPVARQKFYLLDADLASILRKVSKIKNAKDDNLISSFGMFAKFGTIDKELAEIQKHVKYEATTDFEGKAKFDNVECKKYFLFGLAPTRKSSAVWNIPLEIKEGSNTIVLDQNNAAYTL